jgi:hypothetical protein
MSARNFPRKATPGYPRLFLNWSRRPFSISRRASRAEPLDHGFGALAVAQFFVAVAGAPRVRDAPPDRPGALGRSPEASVSP